MSLRNLIVGLLLASSAMAGDRASLVNLFHSNLPRYVNPNSAMTTADMVDTFIGDAITRGLLKTQSEIIEAKLIYAEIVAAYEATSGSNAGGGIVLNPLSVTEIENNDTMGLADADAPGSFPSTMTGTVGPTTAGVTFDPRDAYSVTLPQGAYNISVSYTNVALTVPPALQVSDTCGRFFLQAVQFVAGALSRQIVVELPAGTYTFTVLPGVAGANAYTVTISQITMAHLATGNPFADLCTSGPVVDAIGLARDIHCYRLNVTADSLVNVRVTGAVGSNFAFVFANPKSGRIFVMDNVGTVTDPSLIMPLPTGNYIIYLLEALNAALGYTISATCTAQTITPLPCGTAVAGNLTTLDQRDLFSVATTALASVAVQTTLGTLTDTIIEYYDRNMSPLAENDDASGFGFASFIKLPLPTGTYYVSCRPFSGSGAIGAYGITATCGPLQTITALNNEQTTVTNSIALLDSTAFSYVECTPTHLEITASSISARLSVYGSDGLCRGWYGIGGAPGSTAIVGTSVRANETIYIVARTTSATAFTPFAMYVQGGIGLTNGWVTTTGTLQVLDKVGGNHIVFLGNATPAFTFPPIAGFICQDLSVLNLWLPTVTGNGRNNYPGLTGNLPSVAPFVWQAVWFQGLLSPAKMTNTIQ